MPVSTSIRVPILIPRRVRRALFHRRQRSAIARRLGEAPLHRDATLGQMQGQPFLSVFVNRGTLSDLLQTVAHDELVEASGRQRGRDVDEDTDGGVGHVAKSVAAEENCGDDARAQVTGEVGGDGDARETPDHDGVSEADGEGGGGRGDEGVGRVEAGPDDHADVEVDEEFDEEEEAVGLREGFRVGWGTRGEDAEDAGGTAVEDGAETLAGDFGGVERDLLVVLAVDEEAGEEGAEDLGEDVVGDFFPGETLPDGEGDGHGRVEMTS